MASHFRDISRCLSKWFIEIYRVGDNRRTVNTSTTPHICDQLGTESACKTLLCQFIVMIWVLVCNNMYRYQHHFGLFYRNPTILETVSMLAANGSTRDNFCFYWNTTTGNNPITDISLLRQNVKIKRKAYFSYHFPRWPVGAFKPHGTQVSRLRHHWPFQHSRESERQNIIDKTYTWQQCLVIISEDILKTKYDFHLR